MQNSNSNNYQVVYKMAIAMALIQKGYTVVSTMPSPHKQGFIAWIFERSTEFDKDFDNLVRKE